LLGQGIQEKYTAAVIAKEDDAAVWIKILSGSGAELRGVSAKNWKKELNELKPRIIDSIS